MIAVIFDLFYEPSTLCGRYLFLRNFILINNMIVWGTDRDRCDVSLSTLIFMNFLPA